MQFRLDINGIRAFAVAAVLLYHFNVPGFSGGFVGVDIFFVLSGYLMTGIVFSSMDKGCFSLTAFYLARAKRIIPALLALCLLVMIFGTFFLLPDDLAELRQHITSSILFYSNIFYWQEVNYFAAAANEKWLLHTWSLSVEWQFYLLFPLAILLLRRFFASSVIKWILLLATLCSFALSVWASHKMPVAAFYLLPTRAWEMLVGGLVYFTIPFSGRLATVAERAGLLIIIACIAGFNHSMVWPGYLAVVPVIGTLLVLLGNQQNSFFTANPIAQFLGKVSYSLYLWHWPVVVCFYYIGFMKQPIWVALGISLSIVLGLLSYWLVEEPIRKWRLKKEAHHFIYPLGLSVALLLGINFLSGSYINSTLPSEIEYYLDNNKFTSIEEGFCFYDLNFSSKAPRVPSTEGLKCKLSQAINEKHKNTVGKKVLLFGDSYAAHYEPLFQLIGRDQHIDITSITTNWCYPGLGNLFPAGGRGTAPHKQCNINRTYLKNNADQFDIVVLGGDWGSLAETEMFTDALELVDYLSSRVGKVIILPSPTRFEFNVARAWPTAVKNGYPINLDNYVGPRDKVVAQAHNKFRELEHRFKNVLFIERDTLFNPNHLSDEGVPYSYDGGHINTAGAKSLFTNFKRNKLEDIFG